MSASNARNNNSSSNNANSLNNYNDSRKIPLYELLRDANINKITYKSTGHQQRRQNYNRNNDRQNSNDDLGYYSDINNSM